ncbi:NYN domain-containing protein [Frigidibacter sp. ROC022]|uniref:NYN domain-containing protein n=1 Tax=Frigidibacter sp. ROC022 TaxID=2971796 RepID=UPI00215B02E9|nr:NYN domain-containing protein [Frigidibacter sp. ROC022]MCR8724935.1 NYN domain-containing protein [Frigidibacter sp. ROC022]
MQRTTPLLAVLIDADNTSAQWAKAIFEEIAALGEASVRRIYGDFASPHLKGWQAKLAPLALVPHHSPANTVGKNSSDISLAIDAMDILHTGRFDGFVIVSSDSDFTRLASRIREQGLDVYGIGQKKTPESFRNACKRFIYIENLIAGDEPAGRGTARQDSSNGSQSESHPDPTPVPETAIKKEPAKNAIPIIVAAMRAIGGDEDWYTLPQIGQYITQANPDFDTRTYGSAKLSDLLKKTGRFEVVQGSGNHLMVRDLA